MGHQTRMWQVYLYQETEVTIIQQWCDLFGRRMIRAGLAREGEVLALGFSEPEFLMQARLLREDGPELVEGAR